ncbi:enoyl-CoA hydratase [Salinarimonas soli]|uniref:Enoyl-CoA hydratase n=1 Tax=Salinarimonas soli TaxID=1638099 RepID=A0A5B2VF47_9HYPH|nr:enoyl-CoA hydratase [Salinarimonas soli]
MRNAIPQRGTREVRVTDEARSTVSLEDLGPGVVLVRIDRREARNALDIPTRVALAAAFTELGQDDAVRAIVLTGTGKAFAAGADLKDMAERSAAEMMLRRSHLQWQAIQACPKPVIAAVNGFALGGGCELAMHADIIIAGESARFGQPEIKVGIMPGAGGTQRMLRALGKFKTMKLLLTGAIIDAAEAERIGLVSEVVPDSDLMARATALALEIAALPPLAAEQIKEVALLGEDIPLASALALERKAFQLLFATQDQKEGMRAFLDKRQPKFEGR